MPPTTDPAAARFTTVLTVELPPGIVERARALTPQGRVVDVDDEYRRVPDVIESAEVASIAGRQPPRLERAHALRWIQSVGAGVNNLLTPDVIGARDLIVTNTSGIHAQAIAEHVFGFILAFTRNLHQAVARQGQGVWDGQPYRKTLRSLPGSTLGVLGLGAIGQRIAEIGAAFGQRVIGLKRHPAPIDGVARVYGPDELLPFLAESHYVVNALPLTAATRGLIGARELAALPQGAFFVNIGRGATVDTAALLGALQSGHLGGAGLDVTDPEPLPADHPLWQLPNVLITPHYAGSHPGARQDLGELFLENLRRYVAREPLVNVVDKAAGY